MVFFYFQLSLVLHNAPDDFSKSLINYFTDIINWSNKRLQLLNTIITQKLGLFRYRSLNYDQHSDHTRHHTPHTTAIGKVCILYLFE